MQWKLDVHETIVFMFDICCPQPPVCSIYLLYSCEKERRGIRSPEIVITSHPLIMMLIVKTTPLMNNNMVDCSYSIKPCESYR